MLLFPVSNLVGLPLLLPLIVLATTALADIHNITDPANVTIPDYTGPICFNDTQPLSEQKQVLVIVGDGSNADEVHPLIYMLERETKANVRVLCVSAAASTSSDAAILLRGNYYPVSSVACSTTLVDNTLSKIETYDLVVIPGGYTAIAPMRSHDKIAPALNSYLFGSSRKSNKTKALFLVSGANDLLVDTDVIGKLQLNENNTIPPLTPSVTAAVLRAACSSGKEKETTMPECPALNATSDYQVFDTADNRRLYVAAEASLLPTLWGIWTAGDKSSRSLIRESDDSNVTTTYTAAPGENCTGVPFEPSMYPKESKVQPLPTTLWEHIIQNATHTGIKPIPAEQIVENISSQCVNADGLNFCDGAYIAIIAAHGSHNAQIITLYDAFRALGARARIFCADNNTDDKVYLSPLPALVPTHYATCDGYYNDSVILKQHLIFLTSSPTSIYDELRFSRTLRDALQYSGTYTLYGAALDMLSSILIDDIFRPTSVKETDIEEVPHCPLTDNDITQLDLNISHNQSVMYFRNSLERRSKVLAGYNNVLDIMDNMTEIINVSVTMLVWQNGKSQRIDSWVALAVLGGCVTCILFVIVTLCVRERCPLFAFGKGRGAPSSRTSSSGEMHPPTHPRSADIDDDLSKPLNKGA